MNLVGKLHPEYGLNCVKENSSRADDVSDRKVSPRRHKAAASRLRLVPLNGDPKSEIGDEGDQDVRDGLGTF